MTLASCSYFFLRDPVFLLSASSYLANRFLLEELPFFDNYFSDFLLIPCALPPLLFFYQLMGMRRGANYPEFGEVILHLLVWSIFCELIGPLVLGLGVGDTLDVLAYTCGALLSLKNLEP